MFLSVGHFVLEWEQEMETTAKLFGLLSDQSLAMPGHPSVRTIGRAAWHIVTTLPEMLEKIGIDVGGPTEKDPIPARAADIVAAYRKHGMALLNAVKKWSDEDMFKEDELYGRTWKRGVTLWIMLKHEIHHRGQLTVLMRLSDLPVKGIYGPSREEWGQYGMETPSL